jgi:nitrate/nitrite transport system permease protein
MMTTTITLEDVGPDENGPAIGGVAPARYSSLDEVRPQLGASAPPAPKKKASRLVVLVSALTWAAVGIGTLVVIWALAASRNRDLPSPVATFRELRLLLRSPFHNGGPNDLGVGLQLAGSLQRVFVGFGLAAIVGIPFGIVVGTNKYAWKAANPIIQLLRPVSPMAWFPIWLITIKNAPNAAKIVIFITALWPIIINTAAGAAAIPADQANVARVFRFNRRTYARHVVLPNALPGIVTGLRISMGVAWMVIVAVEMLSGGVGIGFFVWDAYNALNLARVVAAILIIGSTGLILDFGFLRLAKRVALHPVRD